MDLISAIKSGRRIKRKDWLCFYHTKDLDYSFPDILAEDWEVGEEKIEVTKYELEEAWNNSFENSVIERTEFEAFCKELGFKD